MTSPERLLYSHLVIMVAYQSELCTIMYLTLTLILTLRYIIIEIGVLEVPYLAIS